MNSRLESRIERLDAEPNGYAITVDGISKKFRMPKEKKFTIFDNLVGLLRGGSYAYEDFLALQDVSFSVQQGETFGVIGPNGCG